MEVRINDRGPFVEGRVIDLSYAAAKLIEMIGPGIAMVNIKLLEVPNNRYGVQVGLFRERDNAIRLQDRLSRSSTRHRRPNRRLVSRASRRGVKRSGRAQSGGSVASGKGLWQSRDASVIVALVLSWILQVSGTTSSMRGVSAVSDRVVWASGSGGTFLRTVDGGGHWTAATVPSATDMDFRGASRLYAR